MRKPIIQSAVCLWALLSVTSCTTNVSSNEFPTKSVASDQLGLTTYEQAVNAEADRLLKLDTSLTPGAATRQAQKNLSNSFYPETDPSKEIAESKKRKKVAAQKEFEEDFSKAMGK